MRFHFTPWRLAVLLAGICLLAVLGFYLFRTRGGSHPADLVAYLPTANATLAYIDVDSLRRSGVLNMIAGSKAAQDLEYRQFLDATMFDYRQDLDAVAAAFKDGQVFFALRGRFHWKNLMDYAVHQGGSCHNSFCTMESSRPHQRISFYPARSNVMALAISPDDFAAYQIARKSGRLAHTPPSQPIWVLVPSLALRNSATLPAGTKAYASALAQSADDVMLTVGPQDDHLALSLDVACRDVPAASALLADLENNTETLRKWIVREHQQANPADLSGVLVAGAFRREGQRVFGQWPISRAFVDALVGESY